MTFFNMVNMTVSSGGLGTLTLSGPVTADGILYLTFSQAGAVNGDFTSYRIVDGANWELDHGMIGAGGTTLTRGLIKSNTGSLINVTTTATIVCIPLADDVVVGGPPGLGLTSTGSFAGGAGSAFQLVGDYNEVLSIAADTGVRLPLYMRIPSARCRIAAYDNITNENLWLWPLSGQTFFYGGVSNGVDQPLSITGGRVMEVQAFSATKVYVISLA